jgi:SAM-dependent methyltransferase
MQNHLNEYLNAYWLRPETALWRTIDVFTMSKVRFEGKSLDFGCGDGVFSFIRANGTFKKSFDVFYGAGQLDKFYENIDVYNYSLTNHIVTDKIPSYKISVGFDQKQALLDKAKKLNFYEKLILGDGNEKLPFDDNEFDTIFSNIVYWLDDFSFVLNELSRIIKPGGNIYLMLPDNNFFQSSYYYKYQLKDKIEGFEFLKFLDRGRVASNIKLSRASSEWRDEITKSGLKIVDHKMHLSLRLLSIWDVGFRPIFPTLAKATNKMSDDQRQEFKDDLINTLKIYCEPLINLEKIQKQDQKGFNFFHLSK